MRVNLFPSGKVMDWQDLCIFLADEDPQLQRFQIRFLPSTRTIEVREIISDYIVDIDPIAIMLDAPFDIRNAAHVVIDLLAASMSQDQLYHGVSLERFTMERRDIYEEIQVVKNSIKHALDLSRQQLHELLRQHNTAHLSEQ